MRIGVAINENRLDGKAIDDDGDNLFQMRQNLGTGLSFVPI